MAKDFVKLEDVEEAEEVTEALFWPVELFDEVRLPVFRDLWR